MYPNQQPGFNQSSYGPYAGFPQQQQVPTPYGAGHAPQQIPAAVFQGPPPIGFQVPPTNPSIQHSVLQQSQMHGAYPPVQQPFVQQPQTAGYPPMQQPYVPQAHTGGIPQMPNYPLAQMQQFPFNKGRPTLMPEPYFNALNDVGVLRNAMKGLGTDENALISVICRRSVEQRMEIVRTYKTAYGKDLHADITSETSGNFRKVLLGLLTPKYEFLAKELHDAMDGVGTDESVLIELICTMSNYDIKNVCSDYARVYKKSLENDLRGDTSGWFKRLMVSLCAGGRDESSITDRYQAVADAQALKKAGVDKWGTDESEFNRILCMRSYEQLKLICDEYSKLTRSSLEKDIRKEFSGDIRNALVTIVQVSNNRAEFFARCLHKSMAGLGTNDRSLIRLCITRSEIDMMDIKEEFQRVFGKSLKSFISGDTSGDYKKALYALCGEMH